MQHVFMIGAKSLGAYGGYETFVDKLTEYHQNKSEIQYHVACKANGSGCMDETKLQSARILSPSVFLYHNARCFKLKLPNIGPAQAIYYDILALNKSCKYIKKHGIESPIIYIMACRIGPFAKHFYKKIHRLGGRVYVNPDGHEWKRGKWKPYIQKYWKWSEKKMVKNSDLVVCDSKAIESYIQENYARHFKKAQQLATCYIAYGAEIRPSKLSDDDKMLSMWYNKVSVIPHDYYLLVGRFVPENNYETIIREFIRSQSKRDLVIITNINDNFYNYLKTKLSFENDSRIKFVGTVYNQELLKKIRENAYGYIHGHEVGGTNPSLLEALGSTKLNLLYDVEFNREVAMDGAIYWTRDEGYLAALIDKADNMPETEICSLGKRAECRIKEAYSWQFISDEYEKLFGRTKIK